ncbi:MAG: hypothetical protein HY951_11225 [Bacteroidia bacterium]|nr:hypothetical protein [Bacteroidia bacterium]
MKSIIIFTTICLFSISAIGQNITPGYDSTLAKTLGADEYGMKWYVFVILKTGSNNIEDKVKRDSLFAGHMANINRLADLGKLIIAGPFGKNDKTYRGLFILNVKTIDEANELLQTDPAVKAKVFDVELYKWYGSAAISEYLKFHDKIEKTKIE